MLASPTRGFRSIGQCWRVILAIARGTLVSRALWSTLESNSGETSWSAHTLDGITTTTISNTHALKKYRMYARAVTVFTIIGSPRSTLISFGANRSTHAASRPLAQSGELKCPHLLLVWVTLSNIVLRHL